MIFKSEMGGHESYKATLSYCSSIKSLGGGAYLIWDLLEGA